MSMTAFELMAKLGLDKKEYDSGLRDAENEGQNSGSRIGTALGNAAKVGLGLVTAATGAAATGLAVMAKQAVASYAQYEQLIGGVEKLYGTASDKLIEYANEGYRTAGMSSNRYMEVATSFSSALINSLGGDVDKAADMTDLAMQSMSDNVNVFGSDMESVQYAFQGFAKQNYTMLDNLKLGYGGTKTEMERLIKDASLMTDEQKELNVTVREGSLEFDNIVSAIAVVQKHMGIYGTTAKEAMFTLEGAANATKAAWQNVITAIAGGGDLQRAFDSLIESIFGDGREGSGLLANIIPRLQQTMEGISNFVAKASPYIAKAIPDLIQATLPALLDSAINLVMSLARMLPDILKIILDVIPQLMQTVAQALQKEFPVIGAVFEGLAKIVGSLFDFISDNGDKIMAVLAGVLAGFMAFKAINFFQTMIPQIIGLVTSLVTTITGTVSAMTLLGAASTGLTGILGTLSGAVEMLSISITTAVASTGFVVGAIVAAVAAIGVAIYHIATEEEAIKSLDEATKNHEQTMKDLTSAVSSWTDSYKALEDAQKKLAQAEEETGYKGEELYNQVMANKDAYAQFNEEQRRVVDAYSDAKEAQDRETESSQKWAQAVREDSIAALQEQASAVKEGNGTWDEYRQAVIDAFNDQKIEQDDAKVLFANAMTEMSAQSADAFMEQIPDNMKGGLASATMEQQTTLQKWSSEWETIKTFISDVWTGIKDWISEKWTDIQNALANIPEWFKEKFETAKNNVHQAWESIGKWFDDKKNEIKSAFESIPEWFRQKFNDAQNKIREVFDPIVRFFADIWNGIKWVWSEITGWFGGQSQDAEGQMESPWGKIGGFFGDKWNEIKDKFKIGDLKEWGSHMIENFINGIKSAWDRLKGTLEGIAQFIANIFKHTTPKEGPLKDDDEWTAHMMDNFIGGIEKNKGKLKKSMLGVADMMAEPMTMNVDGVFSGASGSRAGGYNQTVNIYSPKALTPYEVARQTRNATRNMVLSMQGV